MTPVSGARAGALFYARHERILLMEVRASGTVHKLQDDKLASAARNLHETQKDEIENATDVRRLGLGGGPL